MEKRGQCRCHGCTHLFELPLLNRYLTNVGELHTHRYRRLIALRHYHGSLKGLNKMMGLACHLLVDSLDKHNKRGL